METITQELKLEDFSDIWGEDIKQVVLDLY
jgi:hypothetical protein